MNDAAVIGFRIIKENTDHEILWIEPFTYFNKELFRNVEIALFEDGWKEASYGGYTPIHLPYECFIFYERIVGCNIPITFPQCRNRSSKITSFAIRDRRSARLIYKGMLNVPLIVSPPISPEFAAGDLTIHYNSEVI